MNDFISLSLSLCEHLGVCLDVLKLPLGLSLQTTYLCIQALVHGGGLLIGLSCGNLALFVKLCLQFLRLLIMIGYIEQYLVMLCGRSAQLIFVLRDQTSN
jgi:hypothetical protein